MPYFYDNKEIIGAITIGQTQYPADWNWSESPVDGVEWREPEPPAPPTTEEMIAGYTAALESYYDTTAQTHRYDNRFTCALRAGYPGPFHAEGEAFAVWMDTCNAYGYTVIADVLAGKRPLPTVEQLIAELPVLTWP